MEGNAQTTGDRGGIDCSVLVPVLNEERFIVDSIRAMQAQRFPGRLEFLVADGGSTDRTLSIVADIARSDPRVRVLKNPRGGTPSGLNVGLAHARGRWVARMDAHTEYSDDYLALGVARLEQGDTRWVSGPPVATGTGPVSRAVSLALRTPLGRGASRKWAAETDASASEYELDSGVFAGVWSRDTLTEYGGWDERWLRNQDSEMAGRFLARGERLICLPAMASRYTPRNTLRGLWRQYLGYGEYREKTAVRHPHTMRRSHLFAPALVLTCAGAITAPRLLRPLARGVMGAYLAAVAWGTVSVAPHAQERRDGALVPAVLVTMHLGHGVGMIRGAVRYGAPLAGTAWAFGLKHLARRLGPAAEPVFAPSLAESAGSAAERPENVA
jgi:glycosyltransferase involved in cell wall biosynthesis